MARFLLSVWPFPGHLNPNLAVAIALRRRGHEVAFYTGGSANGLVEGEGFRCFPFAHVNEEHIWSVVLSLDELSLEWSRARVRKALLREWLIGSVPSQIEDLEPIIADWAPDVFVCDPAMWGPLLVLHERHRRPLAILSYVAACMLPGPDGPILGVPLPRSGAWPARASRRLIRAGMDFLGRDVRRDAEGIRHRYGLPPLGTTVTAYAGQMPLYLVPSAPEYDYQRTDLPPSVRYVGPCVWDKPVNETAPQWLVELPRDRPLVYVTEGSMHSKAPMVLSCALRGLADLPLRTVLTTGRHRDGTAIDLGSIPANARVEAWVPHSELIPRADAVVTTGGTATVMAALQAGVPLVVIPTAWDQPENAWRVADAGAGVRLTPRECTPERLRNAVWRALGEPALRDNAERLGAALRARGGAPRAAELLEGLASDRVDGQPDPLTLERRR